MANINFFDEQDVPQPRERVKIERLEAKPYPDGWRIKLSINVTPFQERPNLEVRLKNAEGQEVAELSIIETMHKNMEFTLHIRGVISPYGQYSLETDLYYDDRANPQQREAINFVVEAKPLQGESS
ncbi:MAG: hypothetical protein U0528_10970 [Anaerolineae bacterium]|nr:hypothetical protein [Anaerolineae bacterium]